MMKKILYIMLITTLIVTSFTQPAFAETVVENPKDIIITQPGLNYSTSSGKVSILGASDWDYPIYMNGQKLETTAHGFFAEYVSLAAGLNNFVFVNNDKSITVAIIYKPSSSSGSSYSGTAPFDASRYLYLSGSTASYGIVKVNNASRTKDNLEGRELMVPLAKGTTARVIGEDKYFYMLSDYSFAYKSSFDAFEGAIPNNYITGISVKDNPDFNSAEVAFKMNVNALYDYYFDGNRLVLTLYGSKNVAPINLNDNKLVSKITPVTSRMYGSCAYEILLDKGSITNGVYVEFSNGEMILGFKKVPKVSDGNLNNVRIFVDAGHGGSDPGALGPMKTFGPVEKDINLEIAKAAVSYLSSKGANIITTRMDDSNVSLADRMEIVTENKPDISLSIHSNATAVSNNYDNAKGYRTYYTFELPVTGQEDAVSFISRRTAEIVGISYSNKNKSNLAMGRNLYCPSFIFEVGFMSNPDDYEWLLMEENQKVVGEAIGQATVEWFETLNTMDAYDQNSIKIFVNGEKLAFDVEPFIESRRTLVPIRRIFEAFGAVVTWDEQTQTAAVRKGNDNISFTINNNVAVINGVNEQMKVAARIVDGGRTVVPLRFLSEALGYNVEWDGVTQTIKID
ncbi:MAG: N-acetylmuramoyl-L-alanine amidase [Peptostreptococcaceae bacterium]|nr:N-acetylmuramoyl-L-alanine amidase [Peptostreptococcaceae bacterium]